MKIIVDIIKKFFKRIFFNKVKKIEEKHIEEGKEKNFSYDTKRNKFVKIISRNESIELDELQKRLENNQIFIKDLNIFEVMDLIDKYQKQINELNMKIDNF